jgi:hypothetical protein
MLSGGISPTDLLVDDAKKAPAIPATDRTLLWRFTFRLRFARGIAEFLSLLCCEQMRKDSCVFKNWNSSRTLTNWS